MNFLLIFLSYYVGHLCFKDPLFALILVPIILKYRRKSKLLSLCVVSFISGLVIIYGSATINKMPFSVGYGIVVNTSTNSYIVLTLSGKYYVSSSVHNIYPLDIIYLQGTSKELFFSHLESQFDYQNYLNNKGIFNEIIVEEVTTIIPSLLKYVPKVSNFSLGYPQHLENIKDMILSGMMAKDDSLLESLQSNNMLYLISISGAHLSFLRRTIKKGAPIFFSESKSELLSYLILVPFFVLNITKFAFYRIFVIGILKFINTKYLKSRFSYLEVIVFAAYLFLSINPFLALNPSFYLSFGLMLLYTLMHPSKSKKGKVLGLFLVYFIIIPYNLLTTGSLNFMSLIIPFFITPLIGIYLLVFLLAVILSPYLSLGKGLLNLIYQILSFSQKVNATIHFGSFNKVYSIVLFLIVIIDLYCISAKLVIITKKLIVITPLFLLLVYLPLENSISNYVSFINVGQGDAILFNIQGQSVLVDTGGLKSLDVTKDVLIPYFHKMRIRHLDYLIITHDDFDHNGGKDSLISNFKVGTLIETSSYFPLSIKSATFYSLNNDNYTDDNEKSLILYVSLPKISLLLMGDASVNNEKDIIANYPDLEVDILKVGHHGSNTSTSDVFVSHYRPEIAIVSCGYQNYYGHPHQEVIETLDAYDVQIYRTDLMGTITLNLGII